VVLEEYLEDPRHVLNHDAGLEKDANDGSEMDVDTPDQDANMDVDMPLEATSAVASDPDVLMMEPGSNVRESAPLNSSADTVWTYKERSKWKKAPKKVPVARKAGRNRTAGAKHCSSLRLVIAAHARHVCITRQINLIYDNPGKYRDCGRCSSCNPRTVPDPRPLHCEMATTTTHDPTPSFMKPLAKDLEDISRNLELAAMQLRANVPYQPDMLFIGARSFLPRRRIDQITENFLQIQSEEDLKVRIEGWRYWDDYGTGLWNAVRELQSQLRDTLNTRHEEKLVKQRDAREKMRVEQVRAELDAAGLGNVKRVMLVVPSEGSNTTTVTSSSSHGTLKISDVNRDFPPFHSGVDSNLFYAAKNRKRPATADSHTSTGLPRKTQSRLPPRTTVRYSVNVTYFDLYIY
jgi:hypothetical protein